jgi:hypothetical protein
MQSHNLTLIEKLQQLSPIRLAEVEDFVDFLRTRDAMPPVQGPGQGQSQAAALAAGSGGLLSTRNLALVSAVASAATLATVWDNGFDGDYDLF